MKFNLYIKKIITILLLFILSALMMFSFGKENIFNNLNSNGDYVSQYVDFEEVDSDTSLMPNSSDILISINLPDNKIFFGGAKGDWSIETMDGSKQVESGSITGLAERENITSGFLTSDKSSIILGFTSGYVAIFNLTSKKAEYPAGWNQLTTGLALQKVIKIIQSSGGDLDEFIVFTIKGTSFRVNTRTNDAFAYDTLHLENEEEIECFEDTTSKKMIFGTNLGSVYSYISSSKEIEKILTLSNKKQITTLTYISSTNIFVGQKDGDWASINMDDKSISVEKTWEGVTSINTSLVLPDDNGSEILAGAAGGKWAVIDTNKEAVDGFIVNEGKFAGSKDVNGLINLNPDKNDLFLFFGNNGKWFSQKPMGFVTGFDESAGVTVGAATDEQVSYSVNTVNDYETWPIDIRKYKIQSTITDPGGSDISSTSRTIFDQVGKVDITIDSLLPSSVYTDLRVQLMETDGTTKIGNEWDTNIDLETSLGRVKGITSASIDDDTITSTGFQLLVDGFNCDVPEGGAVADFTIRVLANVDGSTSQTNIWESPTENTSPSSLTFDVVGLNPGTKYENISVQIFYGEEGQDTPFKIETLTTLNSPTDLSAEITDIKTSDSFSISIDVDAEDVTKPIFGKDDPTNGNKYDGYYVQVTGDDDFAWTSRKQTMAGDELEFTIEDLNPGESYANIDVELTWDKEGNNPIDNCKVENIGTATTLNHIKGFVNIGGTGVDKTGIDDTTIDANSLDIDVNVKAENIDTTIDVDPVFKIEVYYGTKKGEETLHQTTPPSSKSGIQDPIEIEKLESGTKYYFKLQLIEKVPGADEFTNVGSKVDIGDALTTAVEVTAFENLEVIEGSETDKTFDFQVDIKSDEFDSKHVKGYKIKFYADATDPEPTIGEPKLSDEPEEPKWVSGKKTDAGYGIIFKVVGLEASTIYKNSKFELIDFKTERVIDTIDYVGDITTRGTVTTIIPSGPDKPTISNVGAFGFDSSFKVADTYDHSGDKSHEVEEYYVVFYAKVGKNETEEQIFESGNNGEVGSGLTESGKQTLEVTDLLSWKHYIITGMQLVNSAGEEYSDILPMEVEINTKISTKIMITLGIGALFVIVALVGTIAGVTVVIKKKKEGKRDKFVSQMKFF